MKKKQKKDSVRRRAPQMIQVYWIAMLLCLCAGTAAVGIRVAANSTRALSFGEVQARVVMSRRENALSLHSGSREYRLTAAVPPALDAALRLAPPPFSALYWCAQCVWELADFPQRTKNGASR